MLAEPYSFPVGDFLSICNARVPGVTVIGGMASAGTRAGANRLAVDDRILDHGAVALVCSEDVPLRPVVSQGCRPIGMPLTVTSAERNLVHELAGQPAMARLQELVQAATDAERELMRDGLHLGVVVDEHKLDFSRGDFLVRNVLGADRRTGSIAVGDRVDVGTTVQFQVRDADVGRRGPARACSPACTATPRCCSRATAEAGTCSPSRITTPAWSRRCSGTIPLAGAFCAGEIGPIGGRNFLHSFTASVAVFER